MSGGAGSAPTPSSQIADFANKQAELGASWLNFSKESFAVSTARQAEIDALTKQVAQSQIALANDNAAYTKQITDKQMAMAEEQMALGKQVTAKQLEQADYLDQIAKEDRERYNTVFKPIEDQFVNEASNYATEERQDAAAAEAMADVQTAASSARGTALRQATAMGINPTSGRYAGIDRAGELGGALATAGAANSARSTVRDKGLALKADVVNLGKGLPTQSAQATAMGLNASSNALSGSTATTGLGLGAGNAAISNNSNAVGLGMGAQSSALTGLLGANNAYLNSTSQMNTGYGGAISGYGGAASTFNNLFNSQLQAYQTKANQSNSTWGGIGQAIGLGAGLIFSSEEWKEDKEPIEEGAALDAVNEMPVESWKYKEGVADGGEHVGPYAEDFHQATGQGDGKTIPVQDAIGLTMKAVQDLDVKVNKIADAIVGLGGAAPKVSPLRKAKPMEAEAAGAAMPGLGMRRAA
ncbi:hypothetical protein GCM10007913_11890 [Devosia yakushimensis]|uniref:Peptidase S74 domain-containing protein n=1 Tax=Devosia yakushimensis TaxID=470028 RepID=A0ABQ5UAV8_9HYPH|nr:tail fiber domain-containing protein [Devosia yakushimensis]GLQ09257.1 hypothetical protein GCM10007913_11890 [Devosia yakushimensis]